jgi:nicotinamide-nucleotide amidase
MTTDITPLLASRLLERGWMMATAESCTGGLISAHCTELAGSSFWFERGFVTYSNTAKTELLGVEPLLIERDGAVSESVAKAMAWGAFDRSEAQVSVAVTGIAGPGGGSIEKPVGTVWLAWCIEGLTSAEKHCFSGSRTQVRDATVQCALEGLYQRLL